MAFCVQKIILSYFRKMVVKTASYLATYWEAILQKIKLGGDAYALLKGGTDKPVNCP